MAYTTKHDATEERSRKNEVEIDNLRKRYHDNTNDMGSRVVMLEISLTDIKDILKER